MTDTKSRPAAQRPKRTFTVTIGISTVISSILVICTGFVAIFALGVLLGRGYDPEASIPELKGMMPQPGHTSAPLVISEGDPAALPNDTSSNDSGILSQGDLAYPESLRTPQYSAPVKKQEAPKQAPKKTAQPPKAEQTPKSAQQKATPSQQGKASSAPGLAPLALSGTAPATTGQSASSGDKQRYHYVYQAAAYKDQESCDRFSARLVKAGLKARSQKSTDNGTTWYRVMVDFTGKPDDTDALRATLQKHGVSKPLMKSKVPVK